MTVVRIDADRVLVHSPIAASPELLREVASIGPIAFLVAPNRYHHLFVGHWQKAFPDAQVWVAPGVEHKRPDLRIDGVIATGVVAPWSGALDHVGIEGWPMTNEVVFFHRASTTLIATDIALNIGADSPPLTRMAFRLHGTFGRLAPTLLERVAVRDRLAFRRSLEAALAWPFERVVVAHGAVVESQGREALVRGYSWVLG